jgi:sigma-E factor negative regulatory protein RseA
MQNTMKNETVDACELISALADGELQGAELTQALLTLGASAEARAEWHAYHLVGDVLRLGSRAAIGAHDDAFVERVSQRLQQDKPSPPNAGRGGKASVPVSANDSVWRWKLVAGLSSLAVVAGLGWQVAAHRAEDAGLVRLATTAATPGGAQPNSSQAVAQETPIMIRDPFLDQLIAAHQQLGGASALQMPAGFLRNATFQRPAR